ncbi:hypothetical protein EGW08_011290 [Elysia chlorotica]|uniref:Uncharacterized protein n=1 Tax=Elysia chlorotica TaxID=188477 RepID=A0A3S0ZM53_ELYCH|nr:hypothetical protein EGW08_011290 [Elysia chlorotica]
MYKFQTLQATFSTIEYNNLFHNQHSGLLESWCLQLLTITAMYLSTMLPHFPYLPQHLDLRLIVYSTHTCSFCTTIICFADADRLALSCISTTKQILGEKKLDSPVLLNFNDKFNSIERCKAIYL